MFEFFNFDEKINLDEKLSAYSPKPGIPHFLKFDLDGDFIATGNNNSVLVYSTAAMDLVFEKNRKEKGPSSCSWTAELFLICYGRRLLIYHQNKNFVLHKQLVLPTVTMINENATIQLLQKENRHWLSN